MGHKFYVAVILLLILLAGSLFVGWGVGSIQQSVSRDLDQAVAAAEKGDLESAGRSILDAKDRWNKYRKLLAALSLHEPMDEIDQLFSQAAACIQTESRDLFLPVCVQLGQYLESISMDHKLTWWNLFTVAYSRGSAP